MKAVVLTGLEKLNVIDVPKPDLQHDTDVLIRMEAIGVCGSDIHYFLTGRIGNQVVDYPFRIGHEGAGMVESVGSDVSNVKPGDRVAIDPAVSCGQCDQCRSGRPHTCRNLQFLGHPSQLPGCLAEYIVMPEDSVYPVAEDMTPEYAAFIEPLSIGTYAAKLMENSRVEKAGILGVGPIGMSVLSSVLAGGVDTIYATDKIDDRLEVAKQAGAVWTGNPGRLDVVEEIRAQEPLLLDAVFECCGEQEALNQALQLLKPGGELLIVGIPDTERVSFDISELRHREITVKNVRRQNQSVQPAIDLVEGGGVNPDLFVTHRFPMEKAQEAFGLVAGYRDGVVKAMIMID